MAIGAPPIPECAQSCYDCENIYLGVKGAFCETFREFIDDPCVAEDCPKYRVADASPVRIINPKYHGHLAPVIDLRSRKRLDDAS